MNRRRLVFIYHSPHFGGAEKHLIELTRALSGRDDCVIWFDPTDFYTEPLGPRSQVQVLPRSYRICHRTVLKFWWDLRKLKPDVVVLVKGIADIYPWSTYAAASAVGAKRVVAIEQLIAEPPPQAVEARGWKGVLRAACGWRARYMWGKRLQGLLIDKTVAVSESVRQRLVEEYHFPAESVTTIYNGIDLAQFRDCRADAGKDGAVVNIVCVARLSPVKRIDLLLESLARLLAHPVPWVCRIVGGGAMEIELREMARELGLANRVEFVGHVKDVRPFLEQAQLAVLSSEKEGLPLSLGEIMGCGIPCVATDVGGNREIVVHGRTGLLVEFGSPAKLAEAIAFMLSKPAERRKMGEEAKRFVHDRFDAGRMIDAYQSVLSSPDEWNSTKGSRSFQPTR